MLYDTSTDSGFLPSLHPAIQDSNVTLPGLFSGIPLWRNPPNNTQTTAVNCRLSSSAEIVDAGEALRSRWTSGMLEDVVGLPMLNIDSRLRLTKPSHQLHWLDINSLNTDCVPLKKMRTPPVQAATDIDADG